MQHEHRMQKLLLRRERRRMDASPAPSAAWTLSLLLGCMRGRRGAKPGVLVRVAATVRSEVS